MKKLALAWVACAACVEATSAPVPPPLTLEVEYTGCSELRAGPICEVAENGHLTIWARAKDASITVEDARVTTSTAVDDGLRFSVDLASGARAVVVRGRRGASEARVSIPLAPYLVLPELDSAETLRHQGKFTEALAALAPLEGDARPQVVARLLGKRARIALAKGEREQAIALFGQAIALDRSTGAVKSELFDRTALGFTLMTSGDLAGADAALTPAVAMVHQAPGLRGDVLHTWGMLLMDRGEPRGALEALERSKLAAQHVNNIPVLRGAQEYGLEVLRHLGRFDTHTVRIREMEMDLRNIERPCDRAMAIHNIAAFRSELETHQKRPPSAETLTGLQEALAMTETACPNPGNRAHYATSLARALTTLHRPAEALALASAAASVDDPRAVARWAEVSAGALLEAGDTTAALAAYTRMGTLAQAQGLRRLSWTAAEGRGRAHIARGDTRRAIDALTEAEETLDGFEFLVPHGAGRAGFYGEYASSAQLLVGLLVDSNRLEEAWNAARRSRRRGISSLEWRSRLESLSPEARTRWYDALEAYTRERSALDNESARDWTLASDALAKARPQRLKSAQALEKALERALSTVGALPRAAVADEPARAGELTLLFHEIENGWVALSLLDGKLSAAEFASASATVSPEVLGATILGPFTAQIERAHAVRLWTMGATDHIDLHALPLAGRALIERLPVVYGLDLPPAAGATVPNEALVIINPRGDLPSAQSEADAAMSAIAGAGWRIRPLVGTDATYANVRTGLESPGIGLVHVAGHGVFSGLDGWQSYLPLADGAALGVPDILTLARVPPRVVLSSCEAGRGIAEGPSTLGLAHALVLVGAQQVVAATRPIRDTDAARLMARLYSEPNFDDLASSLSRAQADLRTNAPELDWASFRVLTP